MGQKNEQQSRFRLPNGIRFKIWGAYALQLLFLSLAGASGTAASPSGEGGCPINGEPNPLPGGEESIIIGGGIGEEDCPTGGNNPPAPPPPGNSVSINSYSGVINLAAAQSFSFSGTCSHTGDPVQLSINGSQSQPTACQANNTWSRSTDLTNAGLNSAGSSFSAQVTHGTAQASREFQYDIEPPVIQTSSSHIEIPMGSFSGSFTAQDAVVYISSITDNRDGNITPSPSNVLAGVPFSTNQAGSHNISFGATDAAGNASEPVQITVQVLNTTHVLSLLTPQSGEQGSDRRPEFTWSIQPMGSYEYRVEVSTVASFSSISASSPLVSDVTWSLPNGIYLGFNQTYYWRVTAFDDGQEIAQESSQFKTRSESIPTINLSVSNPSIQPNGQQEITLHATQGEVGSLAVIYERVGSQWEIIGESLMSANGESFFSTALSSTDTAKTFQYRARLNRDGILGSPSGVAEYTYDPSLGLSRPILSTAVPAANGKMIWQAVDSATSYKVWRRVGLQTCTPGSNSTCYLSTKPFELVTEVSEPFQVENGYIVFQDPSNMSQLLGAAGPHGISYFITAHNELGQNSLRSNSISFGDTKMVRDLEENDPTFLFVMGPFSASIYACGVQNFDLDNSADLVAHVQFQERGANQNCDFEFDDSAITDISIFDSLDRRIEPQSGLDNCIFVSRHTNLNPSASYCFDVCKNDIANNGLSCALRSRKDTPAETNPPEFSGILNAFPDNDGWSFHAEWQPVLIPDEQAGVKVIQYEVSYTNRFDSNTGEPIFGQEALIVPFGTNEVRIPEAQTGEKYQVRVAALDNFGNVSFGGKPEGLEVRVLDNRPKILDVEIYPTNQAGIVRLELATQHRLASKGIKTALSDFRFSQTRGSLALQSLSNLQSRIASLSGHSFQALSNNPQEKSVFYIDARDQLEVGKFQYLEFSVEVEDENGFRSEFRGNSSLIPDVALGTSSFSSSGFACATIDQKQNKTAFGWAISFLLAAGLLFIVRRRKPVKA